MTDGSGDVLTEMRVALARLDERTSGSLEHIADLCAGMQSQLVVLRGDLTNSVSRVATIKADQAKLDSKVDRTWKTTIALGVLVISTAGTSEQVSKLVTALFGTAP